MPLPPHDSAPGRRRTACVACFRLCGWLLPALMLALVPAVIRAQPDGTGAAPVSGSGPAALPAGEGHPRWLWILLGSGGAVLAGMAIYILRLRRSRAQLQNQARLLQSILDSMGEGVAVGNERGELVQVNPRGRKIVGLEIAPGDANQWSESYGLYLPDQTTLFPTADLPLARAIRGEECDQVEMFVRNSTYPEGRWLSVTARPLRNPTGAVQGGVAVFSDITDNKRAEQALRRQIAMTEAFFNQAMSCFVLLDRNLRFLKVNPAYARHYGKQPADFAGRSYLELFSKGQTEADAAALAQFHQVVATKRPFHGTAWPYTFVDQPERGVTYWDSVLQPICDERGEVEMLFFSSLDVTERVRNEDRIRQLNASLEQRVRERTQALEAANQELEAFSYSVSHDLRAPLRSIDGFSRALLEDYAGTLDADGQDFLQRIRAASQRMGQLIDDLLDLSRVSRNEMHRGPVDLSALAATIADGLRSAAPGQRMEFAITPGLLVHGDARLLRLALENLLGNAVKFSRHRPVAQIEFGRTSLAGAPACFVRDNGAGFDPAAAPKLFGAFQRFHTAEEFPGTGIGLATVQRIIHRHGGRIEAESRPGHGATFTFTLPEPIPCSP